MLHKYPVTIERLLNVWISIFTRDWPSELWPAPALSPDSEAFVEARDSAALSAADGDSQQDKPYLLNCKQVLIIK